MRPDFWYMRPRAQSERQTRDDLASSEIAGAHADEKYACQQTQHICR